MLSSPSSLPSPSLLIEQLRSLEAQVPPPGQATLPASSAEHANSANQILNNARSLRERVASETTEANQKLSDLVLDVVLYMEKLESLSRMLALADSCVGQIRARMRASGISIQPPSFPPATTMPSDSVNGPGVSGMPIDSA